MSGGTYGNTHSIEQIYKTITLLPRSRSEYSLESFLGDLVDIDEHGPLRTKGRFKISFYAESMGKGGSGFRLARADGSQKLYFGIAFDRDDTVT